MEITKRPDGTFEITLSKEQLEDLFEQVDKDMAYFDPNGSRFASTMVEFDIEAYEALSN